MTRAPHDLRRPTRRAVHPTRSAPVTAAILAASFALALAVLAAPSPAAPPPATPPSPPPADVRSPSPPRPLAEERLLYEVGWNGFPAGDAEVWLGRGVDDAGRPAYRARGRAQTRPFLDVLHRVRDRADALLAPDLTPVRYSLHRDEHGHVRDLFFAYDPARRVFEGWRDSKDKRVPTLRSAVPDVLDPVTAYFVVRDQPLRPGDRTTVSIWDGRDQWRLTLEVEGAETLRVRAGTWPALRLRPTLVNVTRPERPQHVVREAVFWVSDDYQRRFLLGRGEVFIGALYAELVQRRVLGTGARR